MVFKSINPKNGKLIKSVECISNGQIQEKLNRSIKMFKYMRNEGPAGLERRFEKLEKVKNLLETKKQTLAKTITNEMGKVIKESVAEVEKSISIIDYYMKNAEGFMKEEILETRYKGASVVH